MTDFAKPTLRDVLRRLPELPVPSHARARRVRLANFIRDEESAVLHTRDSGLLAEARRLLGWDDDSLHHFVVSEFVVHTSPHASMNAFGQRASYSWLARRILREAVSPHAHATHLRTSLTHNNLGDLKWRPYAWWHRSRGGRVVKQNLFTRNHTVRHKTLLSQAPPTISAANLQDDDAAAVGLAAAARNYAYQCILYTLAVERAADFRAPGAFIEVPFDLLNRFAVADTEECAVFAAAAGAHGLKCIGADGELASVPNAEIALLACDAPALSTQFIGSNHVNFMLTYRLAPSVVIGGSHMAEYAPHMHLQIDGFYRQRGETVPMPTLLPVVRFPVERLMPIDPLGQAVLSASQVPNTLAIACADHGKGLASRLDALLDESAEHITSGSMVFTAEEPIHGGSKRLEPPP